MDSKMSPETRRFTQQGFYVDDGTTSSMEIAGLEYCKCTSFQEVWLQFEACAKVLPKEQRHYNNFYNGKFPWLVELIPTLDVYLCAKYRIQWKL